MRDIFFKTLHSKMSLNKDIYFICADLGFGFADRIKEDFPDRFYNVQAAEMAMMDIGVGLALSNCIPVVYSITPFLLYRPFEAIRLYVNHEKIPVKMVGSGRGRDYKHDNFSHWAEDDIHIKRFFPNIICRWPDDKESIPAVVDQMLNTNEPFYINLKR